MAIENSVVLTDQSGREIPANNIIISEVTFPIPTRQFDKDGNFTGVQRIMTAVQASAITPADGMVLYVSSTNGTFTVVGFWGYENALWVKL
jgi:hypothetical protein